ncbi:YwdI family protein [Lysinibacillus louembei]|uniref:YwdI family protein n=1 Tax=Lysinibacillus louembei TaxID=1470088 RepID=A0ABZ0RYN0_9BACI|nr:YwdI family protein [Lysinibacillus louembei]WPK12580.1 YwdI family protein [Lysinibacillus louembei]
MISYDVLLKQLEQHVLQAKNAVNEQEMREHLSAVRALCDVVLTAQSKPQIAALPQVITPQTTAQATAQATPLQENGANGDSLFDF